MKNNFALLTLLTSLLIFSCNNKNDQGKLELKGEIKNIDDQKIYLEQLYFSQKDPEVLDTAEIKNGKFQLSAISQEEGLYRLRLEKMDHGFIFINDKPQVNFKADMKDISLEGPVFNTQANEQLKKLLLNINDRNKEVTSTSAIIDSLRKTSSNDSMVAIENSKLDLQVKQFKNFIIKFIDTASDPVVTMFALGYTKNIDPTLLKDVIPNLAKRFPKHQGIASIILQYNEFIAQKNKPQPVTAGTAQTGSIAPDFTMNDINNKPFSLSNLKGKFVLLDFWASWCGPCRGENPNVVAAYNKYKGKNFTILGVSLDEDKAAWIKAIKDDGLAWDQISDLKGWSSAAKPLYGFDAIPYNVLIDPQGKIIATSLRGEALENKLNEVLQ